MQMTKRIPGDMDDCVLQLQDAMGKFVCGRQQAGIWSRSSMMSHLMAWAFVASPFQ
jgi:hypothetical protein